MKTKLRRMLALLLAMSMSLSLLSANVWAAEFNPQSEPKTTAVEVTEEETEPAQSSEETSGEESAQGEETVEEENAVSEVEKTDETSIATEEETADAEEATNDEETSEDEIPAEDEKTSEDEVPAEENEAIGTDTKSEEESVAEKDEKPTPESVGNVANSNEDNDDNPSVLDVDEIEYEETVSDLTTMESSITSYRQTDSRWASHQYGYSDTAGTKKATIGSAGCGILSYTNAVYYLNGSFIDPITLADYAVKNGYRVNGVGTAMGLYKSFADNRGAQYNIAYDSSVSGYSNLKEKLNKGYAAICSKPGHIMCIVDYSSSSDKYLLLDSYPSSNRGTSSGYAWKTQSQLNSLELRTTFYIIKPINAKPAKVEITSIQTEDTSSVTINWKKSNGAKSYIIKRRKSDENDYKPIKTDYSGTSYKDTGLAAGGKYWYIVCASNGSETSPNSTAVAGYTKCAAPQINSITGDSTSSITIKWNKVTGAKTYVIARRKAGVNGYTDIKTEYTSTSFTDSGLEAGTRYWYYVKAVTENNVRSKGSDSIDCFTKPAAPTITSVTTNSESQLTVAWNSVTGGSTFRIMRKKDGASSYSQIATGVTGTSYSDKNLEKNTKYWYIIYAVTNATDTEKKTSESAASAAKDGKTKTANVSSCTIAIFPTVCPYDGTAKTPDVTVKNGSTTLTKNTDYTLSYSNNINIGKTAKVVIVGKGNYYGSAEKSFEIRKKPNFGEPLNIGSDFNSTIKNVCGGTVVDWNVSGNEVSGWQTNGKDNQIWHFKRNSDGSYKILSKQDESMALDVDNAKYGSGANVQTWKSNDTSAQKWYIYSGGDNSYYLMPGCTDYAVLDLDHGYTTNGTIIHTWAYYDGGNTIKWFIDGATHPTQTKPIQEIDIALEKSHIKEKETTRVSANAKGQITYSSGNPSVATVNSNGVITGVNAGSAEITISAAETSEYLAATYKLTIIVEHDYHAAVTREPGCETEGIRTYTCLGCNDSYTEAIEATGHDYEETIVQPTCTQKGYTLHKCKHCEKNYQDSDTEALGHDWDDGEITKEATTTEEGVVTYTCARCQETTTESIPKIQTDAEPEVIFTVANVNASKGAEITVPVSITLNPGIAGFALDIDYDHDFLTLNKVEAASDLGGTFTVNNDSITWFAGENITFTGKVFDLTFAVSDLVSSEEITEVSLSMHDDKPNVVNEDANDLITDFQVGIVSIESAVPGDVTGDGDVTIADVVKINRHVVGKITLTEAEQRAADVTGDDDVTIADVVKLNRFVIGKIEALTVASSVSTQEAGEAVITVGNIYATPGEKVSVPVSISSNPGIAGMALEFTLSDGLILDSITAGDVLKNGTFTQNGNTITWFTSDNVTENGEILYLNITAPQSLGEYTIKTALKENKTSNFSDEDSENVSVRFTEGKLKVEERAEPHTHTWDDGSVTTPATCKSEGVKTFTCSGCTETKTGNIAKDPSNHVGGTEIRNQKDATCGEAGYTGDTCCKGCGVKLSSGEVINAKGHKLSKTDAKAATCTEVGNTAYWTCSQCHKLFSDEEGKTETTLDATVIKSEGHQLTKTNAKAATCTEDGNSAYWTCSECHKLFSDEKGEKETTKAATVVKATGHTWDNGNVTTPATTTVEGVKTYTCKVCHKTKTERIAKLAKVANTITGAAAFTKTVNVKKDQSFNLGASANGAALTYKCGNKRVSVNNGKVTIKKGFAGKATITITAAETDRYLAAQKQVTVTVNPSVTQISSVKWDAKKKVSNISWAKNSTGKGYEIQVSRQKNFKKVEKKAVIKTNATVKTTISGLKKGTYYFHMRTVNGKNYSAWSKVKTLKIAK